MYADISFEDKNPCSIVTVWPELPEHIKAAVIRTTEVYADVMEPDTQKALEKLYT
jgi:hypothetical protein